MALKGYWKKRDFKQTPEPRGENAFPRQQKSGPAEKLPSRSYRNDLCVTLCSLWLARRYCRSFTGSIDPKS